MSLRKAFCLAVVIGLSANAQTVINLGGVVSNTKGQPVANAIVTLARQAMKDTTAADGKYLFSKTVAVKLPALVPQTEEISINNGVLQFTLSNSSPVKVEIFDVKGNLLKKEVVKSAAAGAYRFDIAKNCPATNLLVVKAAIGKREVSFPYVTLHSGKYSLNRSGAYASPFGGGLAQMAAVLDTLKITATGFQTKSVTITSYENQQQNITLDSSGGQNPPGPSLGCGKTLGSINKSGTYTVKSSNTNRTFIINIPTNYDKNTPYRLIFGMHCMGGSAEKVAGTTDQSAYFYHIKTQADKDNIQCIYVAMQGDAGGTWQGEPDRTFFFDLQKMLKDTLCIDTTRVFSVGFSFGAMFTYALSLKYPKILRAAACNAPANYNMDQPPNQHIPLAYVQTTGTGDGTCPWVQGSSTTNGGKYCLLQHAQDNGCTSTIADVKLATSGTHVVTEFKGCQDGYPVKFCSHNGGHECNKTDQGSNVDWIPVEFWEFFKRF
jgi:poly(3-hydroxybutyrate) depolymerase